MPDRPLSQAPHLRTGRLGEMRAVEVLQARGYELVEMNWRCAHGELDAVMWDGGELVFVEVKTRTGVSHGSAEESMTAAKAAKLTVAAEWYLAEHPELGDPIWRIDLLAVALDPAGRVERMRHITNVAFER